jgi:hypothetical protein
MKSRWRIAYILIGLVLATVCGVAEAPPATRMRALEVLKEAFVDVNDLETARRYYERGLSLIDKPNQPLAPREGLEVNINEVKGTSKCMLGMVYIMLAKKAYNSGDDMKEYEYLMRAKRQIAEGLKLEPSPHVRAVAEDLVRRYNLDKL